MQGLPAKLPLAYIETLGKEATHCCCASRGWTRLELGCQLHAILTTLLYPVPMADFISSHGTWDIIAEFRQGPMTLFITVCLMSVTERSEWAKDKSW